MSWQNRIKGHDTVDPNILTHNKNNWREHPSFQREAINGVLDQVGWVQSVIVNQTTGNIVDGHLRVEEAIKSKQRVPVVYVELSEDEEKLILATIDPISGMAETNSQILNGLINDLQIDNDQVNNLINSIKDNNNLDKLNTDINEKNQDDVPEIPDEPFTQLGDLYEIGNHRLLCGDSTKLEDVERLMDGIKIDLIHTDPPYGINEKGDRRKRNAKNSLREGVQYKDFNDSTVDVAIDAFNLCEDLNILRQVWWGANYYSHTVPQTNNWFVWDKRVEDKQKDLNSDCELAYVKSKWASVRIFRHLWKGLIKGSEHGQARVHPTQKPVALIEWVIDYYKDVNTILDLFGGSGSTMIAAEKKECNSFLMELEPHYCDVIVKRMINLIPDIPIRHNGKLIENSIF